MKRIPKLLLITTVICFFPFTVFGATGTIANGSYSKIIDSQSGLFNNLLNQRINWFWAGSPYPVQVSNTELSGLVWGESIGWISLNCSTLSSCGSNNFKVSHDGNGNLSGYAWGEQTGWISFSCANSETNNCTLNNNARVTINPNTGTFSGYAWSQNFGWISFACPSSDSCVQTTWRKSHSSSGGGGGGGNKKKKPILPIPTITPATSTLSCSTKLSTSIRFGHQNNYNDVRSLEEFLNTYQGEKLVVNGIYEEPDVLAVIRFQEKFRKEILDPWNLKKGTGHVYITTMAKINSFFCNTEQVQTICPYFKQFHEYGDIGGDVKRIQNYLKNTFKANVDETGVYDQKTVVAVKNFQELYASDILSKWGFIRGTGRWYVTTRRKANELLGCKEPPVYEVLLKQTLR